MRAPPPRAPKRNVSIDVDSDAIDPIVDQMIGRTVRLLPEQSFDLLRNLLRGGLADGLSNCLKITHVAVDRAGQPVLRLELDPVPFDLKLSAALRALGFEGLRHPDSPDGAPPLIVERGGRGSNASVVARLFPGLAAAIARQHPAARHLAKPHSIFDPREGGGFW